MARIAGVNIPQNKLVKVGLTYIYGIGEKFSSDICKNLSIPGNKRVNELTDDEILKIREFIDKNFTVEGDLRRDNSFSISGLMINYDTNNSGNYIFNNSTINGAVLNYGSNFQLNNSTNITGSVVSKYLVTINSSSSITKGNLPSFYGQNNGLSPSVIPGSYLEY